MKPCRWTEDEDGYWDTECGGKFELIDGTPSENSMHYCPYCGKSLKEVREHGEGDVVDRQEPDAIDRAKADMEEKGQR